MNRSFLYLGAIVLSLFVSGCLRSYSVITINKDGTGRIVDTLLFAPRLITMMQSVADLQNAGGDSATKPQELWNDSTVQADAASFGPGVTLSSVIPLEQQGFKGYVAVFDIADVTKLRINKNRTAERLATQADDNGSGGQAGEEEKQELSFEYDKRGHLVIHNSMGDIDPSDESSSKEPPKTLDEQRQALDMMGGFMRGMRMRVGIQINGTIAATNAKHVSNNLITLMEVDFDKLLATWDENVELFNSFDTIKGGDSKAVEEALSKYPPNTLVVETQPKITVSF